MANTIKKVGSKRGFSYRNLKPINKSNWVGKQAHSRSELLPATRTWKSVKIVRVAKPKWYIGRWKPLYQVQRKSTSGKGITLSSSIKAIRKDARTVGRGAKKELRWARRKLR